MCVCVLYQEEEKEKTKTEKKRKEIVKLFVVVIVSHIERMSVCLYTFTTTSCVPQVFFPRKFFFLSLSCFSIVCECDVKRRSRGRVAG